MFSMSSMLVNRPTTRTLICCRPLSTKLPPALALLLASCCSTVARLSPCATSASGLSRDLIFARGAAKTRDVHDVRNGFELFFELPVFDGLQVHQVVFRIRTGERVPINLADRAPIAPHHGLKTRGQRDLREALQNFRAVPVVVGHVIEDQRHCGKARTTNQSGDAQGVAARSSELRSAR